MKDDIMKRIDHKIREIDQEMDQRSSIAAVIAHAVRESLEHDRPMTMVMDMKTGIWTATYDKPKPTPRAGFIRRYLSGERNAS